MCILLDDDDQYLFVVMVDVCNVCVSPTKLSSSPDTMVIIPIHQVELLRYR